MRVVVMRKPVLMEDEGRHHLERTFATRKEAEEYIAQQDDYFYPQDFYIVEEPE